MYRRILSLIIKGLLLGIVTYVLIPFNLSLLEKFTYEHRETVFRSVFTKGRGLFGYTLRPNLDLNADIWTPGVRGRLRTDSEGRRITPEPKTENLPAILFFGSSTAFGVGVNDDETYPYRVGERLADRFRSENYAVPGWNYAHVLRRLEVLFALRPVNRPVRKVLLAWGPRDPEFYMSNYPGRKNHFPDSMSRYEQQRHVFDVQGELLKQIRALCEKNRAELTVLVLAKSKQWRKPETDYSRLIAFLRSQSISYLDYSDLGDWPRNSRFDPHPAPAWHHEIAERLIRYLEDPNRNS